MNYKTSVSFTLIGNNFEPEEITAKLGITPTKTRRVGELICPNGSKRMKHNIWKLESKLDKSVELEEHIKCVFEQLQPSWEVLVEICACYYAEISCAIYVYGQVPAIHFDKDIIDMASKLNAEIDVDLYVLQDEKSTTQQFSEIN